MKRTLAVILSLVLLFTAVPFMAQAESCDHSRGYAWVYDALDGGVYDCTNADGGRRYKVCASCNAAIETDDSGNPVYSDVPQQESHRWAEYSETTVKATCTEDGVQGYKCTICDAQKTSVTGKLGHDWSDWAVAVKCFEGADPMQFGTYKRTCNRCKTASETKTINNHTYLVIEGNEPTCHMEGSTDFLRCTDCGTSRESITIDKLPHVDENEDGKCDLCDGIMTGNGYACRCLCHVEMGLVQNLVLPILKMLWQLLGVNELCDCGAVHY